MHECPHCGSQTITCRHCSWTWNPRDPENLPDTCPRCRNDWRVPIKWNVNSKYSHGLTGLKPISSKELEKLKKRLGVKMIRIDDHINNQVYETEGDDNSFEVGQLKPKSKAHEIKEEIGI